ncbi:hypothetical protein [Falsiphaeobacter marinintestinus]|uniref:hypothetical protein n=1 Tax=Falsiphaeobacter marinintestinus TaxID=1492905 RepID=UPI001FE8EB1D|nr:hypothetical protein [Phaeobacter marinintestinus]
MMTVPRNTHEQLIIADTPWLIGIALVFFIVAFGGAGAFAALAGIRDGDIVLILFGAVFAVLGGGLGVGGLNVFVRRVQVIFDRTDNTLTIRRRTLFDYSEVHHPLTDLSHAKLEKTTGKKGGAMYRPVLVFDKGMSAGDHPIVQAFTNTGGPKRLVDAVNRWMTLA